MLEYDDIDETVEQSSTAVIPLAIAGLGIILGVVGLYFGFTAKQDLNRLEASMQESSVGSTQVETVLNSMDSQLAELEKQLITQTNVVNRLRVYSNQQEKNLKKLVSELTTNRKQIEANAQDLARFKQSAGIPSAGARPFTKASEASSPAAPQKEQIYTIAPGDTFSRIAAKFDVTVDAIIDANPDADPWRLLVGQEIVIPLQ